MGAAKKEVELVIYGAGPRDPKPVDPAEVQFTTKPARSCRNCLFDRQWYTVCEKANAIAEKAGLVGCEKGKVIYVPKKLDPRQVDIMDVLK